MGIIEDVLISISTQYTDVATPKVVKSLRQFKKDLTATGVGTVQATMAMQSMGVTQNKLNDLNVASKKGLKDYNDLMTRTRRNALRPFKGEFLSLMFIGMGVQKMFGGMIRTVLGAVGIFDIWRATLISVMLPALMPLIKGLIKFMLYLMQLSPEAKKTITHLVLFAAAIGTLMAMIFPFLLLMSTLGITFKGIGIYLSGGLTGVKAFTGALTKIAPALTILVGVFRIFSGFLSSDWWRVVSGVLLAVLGIVALVFGGWIPALIAGVVMALVWLGDMFPKVAAIIMGVLTPVVMMFTLLYDSIVGIVNLLSGKGFKMGEATKGWFGAIGSKWKGMQEGGIVTRPTLTAIGERGPEAVIPLDKFGSMMNYNPTININATVSSGMDIDRIVSLINEKLYADLRRVGIR